jgi:hypothetical protein
VLTFPVVELGENPEVVAQCVCRPRDVELMLVLARVPRSRGWVITAIADRSSPLVAESNGVVLFVRRKSYTPARAREVFTRLRRAIEDADLGRLGRLVRTGEMDHLFFRRAFGLLNDAEALARRLENATAVELWRAAERGEMTDAELELSLQAARLAFFRLGREGSSGPPN